MTYSIIKPCAVCTDDTQPAEEPLHMVAVCSSRAPHTPAPHTGEEEAAHTMHCTADKGCVSQIFTINFQFSGNLWSGSSGAVFSVSLQTFHTLDSVRIRQEWEEGNDGEQLILNTGLHTERRLHEGAAQPGGGSAHTLGYGNRHRGFNIWALIFFFSLWWRWECKRSHILLLSLLLFLILLSLFLVVVWFLPASFKKNN